jgi:hypothetical protein
MCLRGRASTNASAPSRVRAVCTETRLCVRVRARSLAHTYPHTHTPSRLPTDTSTHSNTPRCVEPASIDASAGSEGSGGGGENPVIAVGCGIVCTVFSTVDGNSGLEAVSYLQV